MLRRLALLAVLALLAPLALAAPQDSQEFGRLSQDQAKLAEQVRRLERLLETLELRERDQGALAKAELLKHARQRLSGLEGSSDLATAVETVALSLAEMRAGIALEAQADLIEELQSLLDFLLQEHLEQQLESLLEAARQRSAALDAMVRRQQELIDQLRRLKGSRGDQAAEGGEPKAGQPEEGETGGGEPPPEGAEGGEDPSGTPPPTAGDPGSETPEASEAPPSDAAELAERQEQLRREIEDMLQQAQAGAAQQSLEGAREKSQQAEQELREQDLEQAERRMEEALEKLQEAKDRAEEQQDQAERREELEDLINLMVSAQGLLDRHRAVEEPLLQFIDASEGERPSRREHARLRTWAEAEQSISEDTAALLVEVDLGGAEMFPFLMQILADDHRRLARDIGPPRYRAGIDQAENCADLSRRWTDLIDAIQTEMDRVRQQIEAPPQAGGQEGEDATDQEQERSLVTFSEELQMLKRVQQELRAQLERYLVRRQALAESGLELDADDLAEIDRIIERQAELRQVYDAILGRLRNEGQEKGAEEDA
ncbi:MAG: DUF4175 family protein [Planctomycetes bacterium]|nr:DUF4175 family protein [Planctomycetota bacterium]